MYCYAIELSFHGSTAVAVNECDHVMSRRGNCLVQQQKHKPANDTTVVQVDWIGPGIIIN